MLTRYDSVSDYLSWAKNAITCSAFFFLGNRTQKQKEGEKYSENPSACGVAESKKGKM